MHIWIWPIELILLVMTSIITLHELKLLKSYLRSTIYATKKNELDRKYCSQSLLVSLLQEKCLEKYLKILILHFDLQLIISMNHFFA